MKRLLSYLFIVLGLGLAFNSHANAKAPSKYICFGQKDNTHYYLDWYNWSYGYSWWNADCKKNGNLISKSKNPNQFDTLKYPFTELHYFSKTFKINSNNEITSSEEEIFKSSFENFARYGGKILYLKIDDFNQLKTNTWLLNVETEKMQGVA